MKHAILGAGAVGGLMGTALGSVGESVSVIVRPEQVALYPGTLSLETLSGRITARAKVAARVEQPADVLWIATKTYQLADALSLIDVAPPTIVPLLNGVDHVAALRARFGDDPVVPATIAVEAERTAPGPFVHRSSVRLSVAASGEPMLKGIVARLDELGFQCQFIASEPTLLWSKLCFLAPFALVCSASGKNLGEILADRGWKDNLHAGVVEASTVAIKAGAQGDAAKVLAIYPGAPQTVRASMAKDLAAGRPLELDGIAGPILRGGVRYSVPVPTTATLVAKVESLVAQRA